MNRKCEGRLISTKVVLSKFDLLLFASMSAAFYGRKTRVFEKKKEE
ncbi:hypothetical protein ERJ70_04025 [Sediminibacillus dalangtanensis]|uniref:Uncharacterized protein n=1 Tax=Sediminibacillus dalangtanensis TaxID=2729421 RepID=A0ABX7VPI9_9BACI|nr:hypothetical protein [Sediminibacillus dalangtanensis]QTM98536.1 hypothetical protein ERJ70_04025 [Sediminibacillus dalangtanensis]